MPWLIIEKGADRGQSIEFSEREKIIIGRDASCEIVLDDRSVSRRHCGLTVKDGNAICKDLDSTHGTFVNGWRVETVVLKDGDSIGCGESVFTFNAEKTRGLTGKLLGGYKVIDRIGRGGMGTVYRAKQVALDRDVALKILAARYVGDSTFIKRFFKEAQAAARLNHPNIVQVYDVREEQGIFFISLELMSEGTVQDLASKEGQLPIAQVLQIGRDAARGLVYAEKRSIVHGDIKPDNLMINADGHIKISDLGLARDAGEVAHQGEEGIFGTPHFVSPEQAQGHAVDSRSDTYSLGATVYRLLTGQTPHSGASVGEIIHKQIHDKPTAIRELRSDCPQDLVDLVDIMMAKAADERFATATELLTALESLGETGTLGAEKPVSMFRAIAILVAVALIGVGLIMFSRSNDNEQDKNPEQRGRIEDPIPRDDDGEVNGTGGNDQQNGDPALQRKLDAARRLIEASSFHQERGRTDEITDVTVLASIKEKYDTLAAAYSDTKDGQDAAEMAREIQQRIESIRAADLAATQAREEKAARMKKLLTDLVAMTDLAIKEGRPADAIAAIDQAAPRLEGSPQADEIGPLRKDIEARVQDFVTRQLTVVKTEESGKKWDAAITRLDRLVTGLSAASEESGAAILTSLLATVSAERTRLATARRQQFQKDLAADQVVVFKALRTAYDRLATGFSCDTALASIEGGLEVAHTDIARAELKRHRDSVVNSTAIRDRIVSEFASGKLNDKSVASGRGIPSGEIVAVDRRGITIQRRNGNREQRNWTDIDTRLGLRLIFRRLAGTDQSELELACASLDALVLDEAERHIASLESRGSGTCAATVAELRASLEREKAAEAALSRLRSLNSAFDDDSRLAFELEAAARSFRDDFRGTRAFIRSSDGSTPILNSPKW